jgi:hypothetical protein
VTILESSSPEMSLSSFGYSVAVLIDSSLSGSALVCGGGSSCEQEVPNDKRELGEALAEDQYSINQTN